MNNDTEDTPDNFYNTNQPPEGFADTTLIAGNLQENMNTSGEGHTAGGIEESIQGSGRREALLNKIQYDSLSYKHDAFDEDARYLGAQFHLKQSKGSLLSSAQQSSSSDATTTANLPDPSEHTGHNDQRRNIGSTDRYKDEVPWSLRQDSDQGFEAPHSQRPSIIVRNANGLITTPVADGLSTLRLGEESTKLLNPQELIVRLCEAFHNLRNEWLQKLVSLPDLHQYCSQLSTWTLFNVGIRTLQGVYNGELPKSFTEIFGFMHLAFAFSRVINEDYDSYYWDGYFSDIYLWHHSLSNTEDLILFARVRDRLWCPRPAAQAITSTNIIHYTPLTAPRHGLPSTSDIQRHSLAPSSGDSLTYPSFIEVTRDALVNTLKEGMVIKGCSDFLNALEFAKIAKRDAACPAYEPSHKPWMPFLEFLVGGVTIPLQEFPAIAPFTKHVLNTERRLQAGLIRTEHELELTLISSEDWSVVDSQAHRRFVIHVAFQCDKAMGNPYWRNNYYIAHLNLVLGLAADLPTNMRRQSVSDVLSEAPVSSQPFTNDVQALLPVLPYSSRLACHNEIEPSFPWNRSDVAFHGTDTTIPTTSPHTSPASMPTNVSTYATTIPDLMVVDSRHPSESSSLASSDLSDDVLTCDFCPGKTFHGKYRSRSWRRHMVAEHSDGPRIPCPEGCDKTFVHGRADNVRRHVNKYHR